MKTCPKCGELNGNIRNDCWKCTTTLKEDTYKKICTKCNLIYYHKAEFCEECNGKLAAYSGESYYTPPSNSNAGCLMYVISSFIPIFGIILGCIYISRGEAEKGKSLIIFSVFAPIIVCSFLILIASFFIA